MDVNAATPQRNRKRRWFQFSLRTLLAVVTVAARPTDTSVAAAPSAEENSRTLFNGHDMHGWSNASNWGVRDGAALSRGSAASTYGGLAIVGDFDLDFEWKNGKAESNRDNRDGSLNAPAGLLSIEYRIIPVTEVTNGSTKVSDRGELHYSFGTGSGWLGLVVELPDAPRLKNGQTGLFLTATPSKNRLLPVGEWNRGRITWRGGVIEHWANGQKVLSYEIATKLKEPQNEELRGVIDSAKGKPHRVEIIPDEPPISYRSVSISTSGTDMSRVARDNNKPQTERHLNDEKDKPAASGRVKVDGKQVERQY